MKKVSNAYKLAMNKMLREQAYISVVLAEVNGIAQNDAAFTSNSAYWSDGKTPFNTNTQYTEYATFEENFCKADGKKLIMPRENSGETIHNVGFCSENILEAVTITFGAAYAIKGLTIDFGDVYPTEFVITTDIDIVGTTYTIDNGYFTTEDTFGDITTLTITPTTMVGGNQRLRIKRILMGVGLSYNNEIISEAELTETISEISENIPETTLNVKVLDVDNKYNVNNTDSFIDYLTTAQTVTLSFGVALDDSDNPEIEWLTAQTLYLTEWSSKDGEFTFTANNLFAVVLDDKYTAGNRIYTRTAYAEAEAIFQDIGLQPDEYFIDDYLKDITLTNPMPEDTHANCLLLLCNICRCIFFQDEYGIIRIQGNFALNLEPEDIDLTVVGETAYSTPSNILTSGAVMTHYADFSQNFACADGTMKILPRNSAEYDGLTGFISNEVADADGNFITNPSIQLDLRAGYTYYGLYLNFKGQPPHEVVITTTYEGNPVGSFTYTDLENENILNTEFATFDVMNIEFTKGGENARVVVDFVGLGNITDYFLVKNNMTDKLIGTREELVKDVSVKIYSYILDENNEPQEVDDDVWYTLTLNTTGCHKEINNPLVDNQSLAEDLAEWLGVYYNNNFSYEVDYRGDPRLNAADIIKLEDEYINNLQVSIGTATLKFNGAFSGNLQMRRAMRD